MNEPNEQSPSPTPVNFRLAGLADSRENVIEAIQAAATIPEAMRAAIVEQIQRSHPNARLIKVDVHCHVGTSRAGKTLNSGHWAITEL